MPRDDFSNEMENFMVGRILYSVCAVALVTATAVIAQPSGSESKSGSDKQICRAAPDTGSRLGRSRICHTAEEWAELRRQTQQNIDRIQTGHATNGN
jgi:hypothetical protein